MLFKAERFFLPILLFSVLITKSQEMQKPITIQVDASKWKAIGKPQQVTDEQYKELERAGQLQLYTSPE